MIVAVAVAVVGVLAAIGVFTHGYKHTHVQ